MKNNFTALPGSVWALGGWLMEIFGSVLTSGP